MINLDRKRIFLLAGIFMGFIVLSFFSGYRIGTETKMDALLRYPDTATAPEAVNSEMAEAESSLKFEEQAVSPPGFELNNEDKRESADLPITPPARKKRVREEPDPIPDEKPSKKREKRVTLKEPKRTKSTEKSALNEKEKRSTESKDSKGSKLRSITTEARQNPRSAVLDSESVRMANRSEKSGASPSYTLQIGAFQNREAAKLMLNDLKKSGFAEAYISESGGSYRVRIGQSLNERESAKIQKSLRSKNYAAFRIKN